MIENNNEKIMKTTFFSLFVIFFLLFIWKMWNYYKTYLKSEFTLLARE